MVQAKIEIYWVTSLKNGGVFLCLDSGFQMVSSSTLSIHMLPFQAPSGSKMAENSAGHTCSQVKV